MLTLTVHMAPIGTPLNNGNGNTSFAGHMWYTLDDGSERLTLSFGFAPLDGATGIKRMLGPGSVYPTDDALYLNTDPTKSIKSGLL